MGGAGVKNKPAICIGKLVGLHERRNTLVEFGEKPFSIEGRELLSAVEFPPGPGSTLRPRRSSRCRGSSSDRFGFETAADTVESEVEARKLYRARLSRQRSTVVVCKMVIKIG